MEYKEIIEKVNEFLIDEFEVEPESIQMEANMVETLDLDSLDYVDMVVIIESIFGFKVTAEDFKSIITFRDFYDYVAQRMQQAV